MNKNSKPRKTYYNLVGQKFGRLTVVEQISDVNNGLCKWLCKCECNTDYIIKAYNLLKENHTKSCGCLTKEKAKNLMLSSNMNKIRDNNRTKSYKGYKEIHGSFFSNIQYSAKNRKLEFDISIEYIWNLFIEQNRKCKLTNLDLCFSDTLKTKKNKTASLDRIDSSKGYIKDNVWWIHKDINIMKRDYTLNYFLELCKLITNPIIINEKYKSKEIYDKRWLGYNDISQTFWNQIYRTAQVRRKNKVDFSITIEDIWNLFIKQNGNCALSGQRLTFGEKCNAKDRTASLDRIDSNGIYEIKNVQWVHKDINQMKWNLEENHFKNLCKLITENNK